MIRVVFSGEVSSHSAIRRSPTTALLGGLVLTLAAVVAYSWYISAQISGLRRLQSEREDRDRKDSLQLIRIQNDLSSLALAMRDMLDNDEPYPLTAYAAQFQRVRNDLDDALRREEQVGAPHTSDQRKYLASSLSQFWDDSDRMLQTAAQGKDNEAREQLRLSLLARHASLSTAVSRLLVQN